ncbi:hypothetical protein [Rhodopirellula sp. MGV]|uniref:hypothetical protein n=1 Tax=Rhodopirellula sp. MGV TaxID=2023130 RepID=UPI000B96EF75|nr:hypothetical protein [Rhodopirellula sp. MGV]OYP31656.1 hypothetical protein CGZ80_20820 [Rhodopirellula sp. MGV]PNY36809.1 hypothetical protein C2E31_11040 [Rhodopirellula baltica]
MICVILVTILCATSAISRLHALEPPRREFRALTVESDAVCRAWLIPRGEALAEERLKSKQLPASYIEELGVIRLTGRMRYKAAITFDELLQSKKLDGLDLSYIDVREDELARISKCRTLRHLYISGVRLSATMIDSLGKMDRLEYLNLFETNLTAKQIEELSTRLPNTKIEAMKSDGLAAACDGYIHLELRK